MSTVVTGALGNVGSAVVEHLRASGQAVRAADLDREALRARFDGVEAVRLDFHDASTFRAAVAEAEAVFLIRPPAISRVGPTLGRFIDAAVGAGVRRVVFSSVAGADRNPIVPHHRIERHILRSGLDWTFLRPGFFAQNIGTAYRRDIVDDDRLYLPAGAGRVAFLDTRDLGHAAAVTLRQPGHAGRAYHLTGPVALTFHEVAAVLGEVLGRPIRYEPAGVLAYLVHLRGQGLLLPQAVVQTILHAGLRRGDAEEVTDALPRLLGRPARSLRDYLEDHASLLARPHG